MLLLLHMEYKLKHQTGFTAQITAELLFHERLLKELPEACADMADRGFKYIVLLLYIKI